MQRKKWTREEFLRLYDSDMSNSELLEEMIKLLNERQGKDKINLEILSKMPDKQLGSILDRLSLIAENDTSSLAMTTDQVGRNTSELPVYNQQDNYAAINYCGEKINISFEGEQGFEILLDIVTGDMFITTTQNIGHDNSMINTLRVCSYCLADQSKLLSVKFPTRIRHRVTKNLIQNIIVCDRFDPVDNTSFLGVVGNKQRQHKNIFSDKFCEKIGKLKMGLIEKYYTKDKVVPVPHFHFGTQSYCVDRRGGEMAISISKLRNYLEDLQNEITKPCENKEESALLNTDIGIPFYHLVTGKLKINVAVFINEMNSVLDNLRITVHGDRGKTAINKFYELLRGICGASGNSKIKTEDELAVLIATFGFIDDMAAELSPENQIQIVKTVKDSCEQTLELYKDMQTTDLELNPEE